MSIASSGRSAWERELNAPLLVTRAEGCRLLSISLSTAIRLEAAGVLRVIKLFPADNAKVYYNRAEIMRLANQQRGGR